ncbi:MAG TPA: TlpA disulfide reductase family protein [Tepidisphaeraceae bacterium]|jgi:thiol-disulfide isomerase/thioredoxin
MKLRNLIAISMLCSTAALAQTTQPTTQRSAQQIIGDLNTTGAKLSESLQGGKAWQSEASRKEAAVKVLPAIHQMAALFQEFRGLQPAMSAQIDDQLTQLRTLALVFNDPDAVSENTKAIAKGDALASAQRATVDFVCAADNATKLKALDSYDTALKREPNNDSITGLLGFIAGAGTADGTPSDEINAKLLAIAKNDAKGQAAEQIAQQLDSAMKLHALENKPLTLSQTAVDGKMFSTANWKGKVILVDFWATWCEPCREELPRVKKIYSDYHGKGLEVLGVSCDNSVDDLKKFLAENPDMPWPQLFDATNPGWNPLAKQYGIMAIPTMFLIDKNGVLRTASARENMEQMIPQLLAEKAK